MAAASPHVGQTGVFNLIVAAHQGRLSILCSLVCYTSECDLQRSRQSVAAFARRRGDLQSVAAFARRRVDLPAFLQMRLPTKWQSSHSLFFVGLDLFP